MKKDTTRTLSLRRTLLFTAIGVVLALALALSSLTRATLTMLDHFRHRYLIRRGSSC